MEDLIATHESILRNFESRFERTLDIDWNDRLIGLTGARGVGKTSFLINHIIKNLSAEAKPLYISMDDIQVSTRTLVECADNWIKQGGTHLFIDEIHKYPNWSQELKNIYDRYRKLKVIFTGSSLLHIQSGKADLSRRAVVYTMNGLSLREFIQIQTGLEFPKIQLEDLLKNHTKIAREIAAKILPIAHYQEYLRYGYYPFYLESTNSYAQKLLNTITLMLETDLPYLRHVDVKYIHKLKKLVYLVSHALPYQPNVSKLAGDLEVARNTIMLYLNYLEEAKLFNLLQSKSSSEANLGKPEKVYLHHPNLMYAISKNTMQDGTVRESFFYNQVANVHKITASLQADFLVNEKYTFEIGGKSKTRKQLKEIPNSFVAADNIEVGNGKTIPLWLFGFLY
jgi:predicted AAA+ superfamily ATPase